MDLPVIDVGPLVTGRGDPAGVIGAVASACADHGFFYVVGHGVDPELTGRLDTAAREFFALPHDVKEGVRMELGGPAWRGWFPLGGELTSGVPDRKEGYYFGSELPADDPRVVAGLPLHGPNLFPDQPAALRPTVLSYLDALTTLGHRLVEAIAASLGIDPTILGSICDDPTVLFRIFRYPASDGGHEWGVGEHTDYGLLTILLQDQHGGLEVLTDGRWTPAPPIEGSFVCNIGDMLDRMTGGRYRSTAHRVRNTSGADRFSFPFFFDPSWGARVPRLVPDPVDTSSGRWDGADVAAFEGTYGEYLLGKVARVFPELDGAVLQTRDERTSGRHHD